MNPSWKTLQTEWPWGCNTSPIKKKNNPGRTQFVGCIKKAPENHRTWRLWARHFPQGDCKNSVLPHSDWRALRDHQHQRLEDPSISPRSAGVKHPPSCWLALLSLLCFFLPRSSPLPASCTTPLWGLAPSLIPHLETWFFLVCAFLNPHFWTFSTSLPLV